MPLSKICYRDRTRHHPPAGTPGGKCNPLEGLSMWGHWADHDRIIEEGERRLRELDELLGQERKYGAGTRDEEDPGAA